MHRAKHPNYSLLVILTVVVVLFACSQEQQSKPLKATDYPEHESESAKLYVSKCSGCHAAPLPKIHTKRHWPGVVQRMQMRMKNKAIQPLNSNEIAIVVSYLQKHAPKQ